MSETQVNKIEAIIRYERLQDVQDALDEIGVSGLNVTEVKGCGRQKGYTEHYRGSQANISLLPKLKVESVVASDLTERAVEAIVAAAYTGETGDGLLFVLPVSDVVRIRTGERDNAALTAVNADEVQRLARLEATAERAGVES
jgi:nitrogen regulatory protein P-II 1